MSLQGIDNIAAYLAQLQGAQQGGTRPLAGLMEQPPDEPAQQVAGGFKVPKIPKVPAGGLPKAPLPSPTPAPAPRAPAPVPRGGGGMADVHEGIRQGEAVINGTPMAPIGTGRRLFLDVLGLMGRRNSNDPRPDPNAPRGPLP